jgi:hypothetical protein
LYFFKNAKKKQKKEIKDMNIKVDDTKIGWREMEEKLPQLDWVVALILSTVHKDWPKENKFLQPLIDRLFTNQPTDQTITLHLPENLKTCLRAHAMTLDYEDPERAVLLTIVYVGEIEV